jgi:hypothetical protein
VLKHADPHQATLVDVSVDRSRRDKVDDTDGLTLLAVSVDTSDALFDPHRVPRKIIVHKKIAELKVQALATDL